MSRSSNILDVLPLTPLQEGLFALNKLSLEDPYHIQLLFRIEGKIDEKLFFQAINNTIDRYPNLRSAFYDEDLESAIQIIAKDIYPNINKIKLDEFNLDINSINKKIYKIAQEDFYKFFDLSYGCPIRVLFINVTDNLNYFILTAHHIIIDGWSLPLFFKEVMNSYELNNRQDLLSSAVDYKDYIIWLKKKDIHQGLIAWQDYLSGVKATKLFSNKISKVNSLCRYNGHLSKSNTKDLITLCRKLKLTLNSVFLFTWSIILGYLTNCLDVVFGVTVSGRPDDLKNVDKMIGLFINTIVCRVKLDCLKSLQEQCCKFQEDLFKIRDYEHIGLSTIQRHLKINNNLFDTLLIFQNTPTTSDDAFELSGATIYPIKLIDSTHYPLTLVAALVDGKFVLEAEIKSDLINIIDGEYIIRKVLFLLENFVKYKNCPLPWIDLSDKSGITNSKEKFNNINNTYGIWGIFRDLFNQDSKAVALIIPDIVNSSSRVFTIGELFYLSEKISSLISSKLDINSQSSIRVGILLPRGEFIISSFFACIKLGLIIIPLDILFPDDMIESIARRSNLKLLISDKDKQIDNIEILNLSRYNFDSMANKELLQDVKFTSLQQEVYTIFTSGTTGISRGVTATQGNIINLFNAHKYFYLNKLSLNKILRVGHGWSFAFDASWQPLIYFLLGNVLVLLDEFIQRDPDLFIKSIHKYNIDFIEISPTLLRNIDLDLLFDSSYHQLQVLGLGGEEIDNNLWDRLSSIDNLKVINFYGPTETCVDVLIADIKDNNFPILGKAIEGVQVFILDKWLRQCDTGIVGEIYISGNQVTCGYLNDYKLTAVKYIAYNNGLRIYRTGDLAYLTKEGFFVYQGRIDNQVKINGFRANPHELENILIENILVADAKVFVIDTKSGKKLSAVIILKYTNVDKEEVVESIYNYLRQSIASHLIPHGIVVVDKFPLTSNGKLDIKSLPKPILRKVRIANTKTEVYLSNIIKKILSSDNELCLDIKADFSSLGLDSILIIQFCNMLKQEGLNNINPRVILRNNNIYDLALFLDNIHLTGGRLNSLAENNSDSNFLINSEINYFKLTPIMSWLVRFDNWRRFCQWSVISIPDNYNYQYLLNNIKNLINIHSILRLKIDESNNFKGIVQNPEKVFEQDILKVLNKGLYEYSKSELKSIVNCTIDEIDPKAGVIFRGLWFPAMGKRGGHIILLIHHLAIDGVSWRIILEDLKNFDNNKILNEITSFARWASILDNKKQVIDFNYIDKWKEYLNINQLPLGLRYIDSSKDLACNSYAKTIVISSKITKLILKLSKQGFVLEHILLTILVDIIAIWYKLKYSKNNINYILIDKESHGRDNNILNSFGKEFDDLSRTLGWFTIISPLKLAINYDEDNIFRKLNSIKRSILNVPSNGLDFSLLEEKINFSSPEIEFNFHGILDSSTKDDSNWKMVIDNKVLDILPEVSEPLLNRVYALEINSIILSNLSDKILTIRLNMSKDVFSYDDFILMQKIWTDTYNKYYEELLLLMGKNKVSKII